MSSVSAVPESGQISAKGRRRFTDQFRQETMTRRIRELYERLLTE